MNYKRLPISVRLVSIKEAILSVLEDPELGIPLAGRGYPIEELEIGLQLQREAVSLFQSRYVKYGTGVRATEMLKEKIKTIRGIAASHRNIARVMLKESPGLREKLRLKEPLAKERDVLFMQVRHFYTTIRDLSELSQLLVPVGITEEVVTGSLADVDALERAMLDQQQYRADARVMTVRRNELLAELDEWTIQFFGTARLVFRGKKEQLKKMGL